MYIKQQRVKNRGVKIKPIILPKTKEVGDSEFSPLP